MEAARRGQHRSTYFEGGCSLSLNRMSAELDQILLGLYNIPTCITQAQAQA